MEAEPKVNINAYQARQISQDAREGAYDKAMQRIHDFAKMGMNEVPLVGMGLNMSDVEKLIQAGYSVSTFENQMDQCTFFKVRW